MGEWELQEVRNSLQSVWNSLCEIVFGYEVLNRNSWFEYLGSLRTQTYLDVCENQVRITEMCLNLITQIESYDLGILAQFDFK